MFKCIRPISTTIKFEPFFSRAYNKHRKPKADKKLQAAAESLATRGFLRSLKPYTPPSDIEDKLQKICFDNGIESAEEFGAPERKFAVLKACYDTFQHGVPNSILHTIESFDDVKEFYKTPVDTTTPFEALKKMDLPKNMHVQKDYMQFHPEKDNFLQRYFRLSHELHHCVRPEDQEEVRGIQGEDVLALNMFQVIE